jgi:hypothetical protein
MPRELKNWLDSYLDYTENTESPENYHIWCGISVLAAAMRRKVWLNMGHFEIYPNMYIVLVGPPGCRKNAAINIAIKLLQNIPEIKYSADAITREALIQVMNEAQTDDVLLNGKAYIHSSLTIISKELSVFVGTKNMDLLTLLTDLYDPHDKWVYRTKGKGINEIIGVWLNLLGGTTPAWLMGSIPMDAIGGGFTSRIIFVVEERSRKRVAFPFLTEADKLLQIKLLHDLGEIAMLRGEFKLTPEARDWFIAWYEPPVNELEIDLRFQGYYERRHVHLLKTAMIISASFSDDMVVKESHLKLALQSIEQIEGRMVNAFGSTGRSTAAADTGDVLNIIVKHRKGISRTDLIRKVWRDVSYGDLDNILKSLEEMGYVKKDLTGNSVKYKPILEEEDEPTIIVTSK